MENYSVKDRYLKNKEAKTGETIKCPICGEVFTKKHYVQTFCCKECKDRYWNSLKSNRHKDKKYYRKYNMSHPERLDRGFTKGYNNGNVSDGIKETHNTNIILNKTLSELLYHKCFVEWHDDDWEESNWDD